MNNINSNVHVFSNVYPVHAKNDYIRIEDNLKYVSIITDRAALKKLVRGSGHWEIDADNLSKIPGIQEWQVRRFKECESCELADPGDKPWGYVIENGVYRSICKCQKKDCPKYRECRPEDEKNDITK